MDKAKRATLTWIAATAVIPAQAQLVSASRPVNLVVPFTAGGPADSVARAIATPLGNELSRSIVIENLPGGSGVIAAQKVLSAPADGQFLFHASPSQLILGGMVNKAIAIDSSDFVPVHMIGTSPYAIMVRSGLKARNVDELAQLAQEAARAGKPLTYASVGIGNVNHLLGEEMSRRMKVEMLHVPYKGGAEVMRDLIGGGVDLLINGYTAQQIGLANSGKFKFIAALSAKRQPLLPDTPSVDESPTLHGFHLEMWNGLFVKHGTPRPVLEALNKAVAGAMSDKALRKLLMDNSGMVPTEPSSLDKTIADYAQGIQHFRALARRAGFS